MNDHELLRAVAAAQAAMGEGWAALIEWALARRHDAQSDKAGQEHPLNETLDYIRYTLVRSRQFETPLIGRHADKPTRVFRRSRQTSDGHACPGLPGGQLARGGLDLSPQLYSTSPLDFVSLKMSWCIAKTGDLARRGLRRMLEHKWGHLLEIAERLGKPIV
jgi:hypothetical protein